MNRLQGKNALITGGSSGIGLATARLFRAEGARVAITSSSDESLAAATAALGPEIVAIRADAADLAAQRSIAKTVQDRFEHLDVLFVNAGIADFRPLDAWDETGFDRSFAVNLKGPFFLVQALLPLFANPASIVLMASINARIGMPNSSVYAATKAAMASLARTLSGELVSRGIRVNAVSPGPIETPLHGGETPAQRAQLTGQIPAGRYGHPDEVATAVLFFASNDSAFTVGSDLVIDGGMSNL